MSILTDAEKQRVSEWQSSDIDNSITTRLFTPVYSYLARKMMPTTVSPNLINLAGLLCQVQAFYLCYLYMDVWPHLVPGIAGALVLLYQALDGIQREHATNTRNESPLGDFFECGCDSIGSTFIILTLSYCLGFDKSTDMAVLWYIVQTYQLLLLQQHLSGFKRGRRVFGLLSGPGEALLISEMVLLAQAVSSVPIQHWVRNIYTKCVVHAVPIGLSSVPGLNLVFPSETSIREWLLQPENVYLSLYIVVLCVSMLRALLLDQKHYATRNGLLLIYTLRSIPALFEHLCQDGRPGLSEVILDGLFLSVVSSDVILCKMAKREIHPLIVIFAMVSLISAPSIVVIVAYYNIKAISEMSIFMNLPILSTAVNVYVDGVYDFCHVGHKRQMSNALQYGNRLIVGVVSDENVYKYKSKYPVMTLEERCREVMELRMVSRVIPNCPCPTPDEWDPLSNVPPTAPIVDEAFIRKHRIHVMVHGEEYLPENIKPGGMDYYKIPREMGIVKTIPRTPGISSTDLMRRMLDRVQSAEATVTRSSDRSSDADASPVVSPVVSATSPDSDAKQSSSRTRRRRGSSAANSIGKPAAGRKRRGRGKALSSPRRKKRGRRARSAAR